jgi:hypothetical protein
LEFPEVIVKRGGFDAFVGNPPFVGGQRITGAFGVPYREYVVHGLGNGKRGSADICAYFFLRAKSLLRDCGLFGLIATNTIAQGDTREVGLDQINNDGGVIIRAVPSRQWAGVANLEVANIWCRIGAWKGAYVLNEHKVETISSFLSVPGVVSGVPYKLKANEDKSFQGSIVLGMGFILTPEEATRLIEKNPRNKEVLFPYLNGEDLNSRPDQSPSRWVINFFDWSVEKAMQYPDCFKIVEEKVKPERLAKQKNSTDRDRAKKWWQYGRGAYALYRTISNLRRVMVGVQTSKYVSISFQPIGHVYSHAPVVVAIDNGSVFRFNCVLAHGMDNTILLKSRDAFAIPA